MNLVYLPQNCSFHPNFHPQRRPAVLVGSSQYHRAWVLSRTFQGSRNLRRETVLEWPVESHTHTHTCASAHTHTCAHTPGVGGMQSMFSLSLRMINSFDHGPRCSLRHPPSPLPEPHLTPSHFIQCAKFLPMSDGYQGLGSRWPMRNRTVFPGVWL